MPAIKTKGESGACTLSHAEIMDLRKKGVSMEKVAKLGGVSKQAISQLIKRNGLDPEEVAQFKKDKSLILHSKQKLLLTHITPERVKTMSIRDAAVSFGILADKQRLEDNLPTVLNGFTKIDLSVYQNPPAVPCHAAQLCTSCRVFSAGVDGGLCETCRADISARGAVAAPALAEGGGDAV